MGGNKSRYLCRARFFLKLCVKVLLSRLISSNTATARKEGIESQSRKNEVMLCTRKGIANLGSIQLILSDNFHYAINVTAIRD